MFVIKNEKTKKPIKIWLNDINEIEDKCLEQAINLSNLPFIHRHVALMPDTHMGYGMPIGGVIATENVIIPNAVGVDIGCGMIFAETNITVNDMREDFGLIETIVEEINETIPTGFNKHRERQSLNLAKPLFYINSCSVDELDSETESMHYQIGTLGGGNHFIELQEDEKGKLNIMIHSGSRNFGYKVANYFNKLAVDLNEKWFTSVPKEYQLAFLPIDTPEGQSYIYYMNGALEFAADNRKRMMKMVMNAIVKHIGKQTVEFKKTINAHHNYASLENHYGKNLWVHRKGAIRAREEEIGIIPGAMGSNSFIVKGLGHKDSFHSCSHGAGRRMSRTKASESFLVEDMMSDLKEKQVILGVKNANKIVDESRFAYKDINEVMFNQKDLAVPIKTLKTVAVIKGS